MTKLHEILAVEADKKGSASKLIGATITDFKNKQGHYYGFIKTYKKDNEEDAGYPDESKEIVTSVPSKLKYLIPFVCDAIDVTVSKEEANCSGQAESPLVIDEINFGDFSPPALLALENKLKEIRAMYDAIPTLDPSKKWIWNDDHGYWETPKSEVTIRTENVHIPIVKYEATKEHPAQTEVIKKDKRVGEYHTKHMSGMITPKQKAMVIGRIDKVIEGVKSARAWGNNAEVENIKVGQKIFEYINGSDIDIERATIDSFNIEE